MNFNKHMMQETWIERGSNDCIKCGRPLDKHYKEELCTLCAEMELFSEVKEFIRSGVVNEYMVAEKFNIPLAKVRRWIREGRIEYNHEKKSTSIANVHCQRCGKSVSFGSVCTDCLKLLNSGTGVYMGIEDVKSEMRFLDKD